MGKISKTTIFILLFIFLFSITVFAHSGGTDSDGGHYDHSTGEYHYHHGYSAHQHDDGICPYASDENDEKDIPFLLDFLFIIIGFAIVGVGILTFFGFTNTPEDEKRFYIIAGFCTVIFGFSLTGLLRKAVIGTSVIYNLIICIVTLLIATPLYLIIRKNDEPQYQTTPSREEQSNPDKPENQTREKEFETPCNIQNDDLIFSWAEQHILTCVSLSEELDVKKSAYNIFENSYATLDFCLFAFFETRKVLCATLKKDIVRKIEDAFFKFLTTYFSNKIHESEANSLIDSRLEKYEELMKSELDDSEKDTELLFEFSNFLLKDFMWTPFDQSIFVEYPEEYTDSLQNVVDLLYMQNEIMKPYTKKLQDEYGI